ncbi:rRNA maturation RNase YbeY [Nonlabens marinus]|nr:rRNA maturation RNase YbeY [Nonlabens marinus]
MIDFAYQTNFELQDHVNYISWLRSVADSHDATIVNVGFVFCDDEYVLEMNQKHLSHDTYTDIITFDYGSQDLLEGEIYISVDRVKANADEYQISFVEELKRVMAHGVLHMIGFGDHDAEEKSVMRTMEDKAIELFHVKH